MKYLAMTRPLDLLGRIVIPIETRRKLNIGEKETLEIYVDGEQIILKKYEPDCLFCGSTGDIIFIKGKRVCSECVNDIRKII